MKIAVKSARRVESVGGGEEETTKNGATETTTIKIIRTKYVSNYI